MHRLNWLWYVICQKWLITIKLTAFRELQVRQQSFLGQSKNKNNNSQHAQKEQCWRSTAWAFGEAVYRERDLDVTVWFGKSTPSLLSNEHILIGGKLQKETGGRRDLKMWHQWRSHLLWFWTKCYTGSWQKWKQPRYLPITKEESWLMGFYIMGEKILMLKM